jgi:AraC-like DNA-binding protein
LAPVAVAPAGRALNFDAGMSVAFHIPTEPLADYISFIWEVDEEPRTETILPQGAVEIVFQFGEAVQGILPHCNTPVTIARCFVQGFNTQTIQATYRGRQHLFGLRLRPHRVRALLGIQPFELMDAAVDLALISPRIDSLWQRLYEAPGFAGRLQVLAEELPLLNTQACPRLQELAALLERPGTGAFQSVDSLARAVCYSTKQLGRVSRQLFGLSAEALTGYKKFLESVSAIHQPHTNLTSIAYDAGFYDQAHFTRVFKSFSGMTPKEYRACKSAVPFHIFP